MKYLLILLLTSCGSISAKDELTCKASCIECKQFNIECKVNGDGIDIKTIEPSNITQG